MGISPSFSFVRPERANACRRMLRRNGERHVLIRREQAVVRLATDHVVTRLQERGVDMPGVVLRHRGQLITSRPGRRATMILPDFLLGRIERKKRRLTEV